MLKNFFFLSAILSSFCSQAEPGLKLSWTNRMLTVSNSKLPGGKLEILYLEAFCRKGSTQRKWGQTVLPHKTELIKAEPTFLSFRTTIEPKAVMLHEIRAGEDELDFKFILTNEGQERLDLEWFQPACIRVDRFTGGDQTNYTGRSFIFTERGLTKLSDTRRRTDALYRGGQVFVPKGINLEDVNPRPISLDQPVNGLIGCFSADGSQLLATASSSTHELFEGVYVCLHSDPHVGGLAPGETKKIEAKLYLLENNYKELLTRYNRDFRQKPF
jgi:hypothetical protein